MARSSPRSHTPLAHTFSSSHQLSLWPQTEKVRSGQENTPIAAGTLPSSTCTVTPAAGPSLGSTGESGGAILAVVLDSVPADAPMTASAVAGHVQTGPASSPWSARRTGPKLERALRNAEPLEWTGKEPPLVLARPWLLRTTIPMAELSRHVLATGETGSGKTRSCIEPLLGPLLDYRLPTLADPVGKEVGLLVIDAKSEFTPRLRSRLMQSGQADRLVVIGGQGAQRGGRIRFFEGQEDLSVADKLKKIDQIAPASWHSPEGDNAMWVDKAKSLVRGFAYAESHVRARGHGSLLAHTLARFNLAGEPRESFFGQLRQLLDYVCQETKRLKELHYFLLDMASQAGFGVADFGFLSPYVATGELIDQFNYVYMSVNILLSGLNRCEVTALVDFDLFGTEEKADHLSIYEMVESGKVIVFSPSAIGQDSTTLVGKVLKTLFFQAVFTRRDKERPVAYICDEFHRFVTCDAESGEQNLLDRCRAYRCICILATQSVESVRYALTGQRNPDAAIGVMLNNIACKLFLRNSDLRTADLLYGLLPRAPGDGPHVVHVRPLTSLQPGEMYFLHADSTWGRAQVALR